MALSPEQRRALAILADAGESGCAEHTLLALGFTMDLLASLIRDELATVWPQRVPVGSGVVDVARMGITEAGRAALAAH